MQYDIYNCQKIILESKHDILLLYSLETEVLADSLIHFHNQRTRNLTPLFDDIHDIQIIKSTKMQSDFEVIIDVRSGVSDHQLFVKNWLMKYDALVTISNKISPYISNLFILEHAIMLLKIGLDEHEIISILKAYQPHKPTQTYDNLKRIYLLKNKRIWS